MLRAEDERPHDGLIDEWIFTAWLPDASLGIVSGHRLFDHGSWYWCALLLADRQLLHLTEFDIAVRRDPMILKAPEMWAEHQCDDPMRQWSIGNEAYFVGLDDAEAALGRGFGDLVPISMDLEFYGFEDPIPFADGYEQSGVVHGEIERLHEPNLAVAEIPAHRWRRWGTDLAAIEIAPVADPLLRAMRVPFRFPDGSVIDWLLTTDGFRSLPQSG